MKAIADEHGFKFLNPDTNQGTSVEGLLETIKQIADSSADLTDWVFFFDTLKKMADLLQKNSVKKFFSLCRRLASKGATIVLLGHANKFRDKEGCLVFEGVGDVKSDSDELIFFERVRNPNGGLDVTTVVDTDRGAKVRGIFKPFSFHISPDREITFYNYPLSVNDRTQSAATKATDEEILEAATACLKEIGVPVLQKDLAARVVDITGAGLNRARKILVQNSEPKDAEVEEGRRFWYSVGESNKYQYELPSENMEPLQGEFWEAERSLAAVASFMEEFAGYFYITVELYNCKTIKLSNANMLPCCPREKMLPSFTVLQNYPRPAS